MSTSCQTHGESGISSRWFLYALLVLAGITLAAHFALAPWAEKKFKQWAATEGFDSAEIRSLNINPLLGKASLEGLALSRAGATVLEVGSGEVSVALLDLLLRGTIRVKHFTITAARINIDSDGKQLSIAGIPAGKGREGKRGGGFELNQFEINDSEIRFRGPLVATRFHVDTMRVAGSEIAARVISLRDLRVSLQRTDVSTWKVAADSSTARGEIGGADTAKNNDLLPPHWSLRVDKIQVTGDSVIHYQDIILGEKIDYRLAIQEAYLNNIDSRKPDQPVEFALQAAATSDERTTIQGHLYPFKIPFELTLRAATEAKALPLLAAVAKSQWGLAVHSKSVSANLHLNIQGHQAQGDIKITLVDTEASTDERTVLKLKEGLVVLPLNDLFRGEPRIKLARFEGSKLYVAASADGVLTVAGLVVTDPSQTLETADKTTAPKHYAVDVLDLKDSEIEFDGPVLDVTAHVNIARATPEGIMAEILSLRDARIAIIHDGSRVWRVLGKSNAFRSEPEQPEATAKVSLMKEGSLPPISIERIQVVGDSEIDYQELNEQGTYRRSLKIEEGYATGLDTAKPDQAVRFHLHGTTNRLEQLSFEGTVRPFIKNSDWNISGTVLGWELPLVSRFTAPDLGFEVRTGQADGNFDIEVVDRQINGKFDLKLNLLETVTTNRKKLRAFESKLPVRLRTATYILSDKYGAIPITIPVSGDTRNPTLGLDIDVDGAISKAITGAFELGLFVAAPGLTALIQEAKRKRLRLPPVEFEPLHTDLDERARKLLAAMARTMRERPKTMAPICGKATDRDLRARPEPAFDMSNIAAQRAWNVKKHLVEQENIEARRLIACQPELVRQERGTTMDDVFEEKAFTTPRVEFE